VANERRIQIIEAGRNVRAAVVQAWNNFVAAGQTIGSLVDQVKANQLALEGVRQEAQVGTRTTLDVLNAEQTLATSQINLVQSQHDQIVQAYQLIASTGQMTAKALGLSVPLYDADANQRRVRDKFIGTDVNTVE
jgi:outer membrane protein TolC